MSSLHTPPQSPAAASAALAAPLEAANTDGSADTTLNTQALESLVGYHARRTSLLLVGVFTEAVQGYALKVVEFSMLSLIKANPGITSRQLCQCLNLLPPNVVATINKLIDQGHITKQALVHDRRAVGLHPTESGVTLITELEAHVAQAEAQALRHLSAKERNQLIALLKKTYAHSTSPPPPLPR